MGLNLATNVYTENIKINSYAYSKVRSVINAITLNVLHTITEELVFNVLEMAL